MNYRAALHVLFGFELNHNSLFCHLESHLGSYVGLILTLVKDYIQQSDWSIVFIGSQIDRSIDGRGDGNSFWGQSREEIHADSPCRALCKKQPLGKKRG